eukprot:1152488-Pelagomonas_calceolata.AAC.9
MRSCTGLYTGSQDPKQGPQTFPVPCYVSDAPHLRMFGECGCLVDCSNLCRDPSGVQSACNMTHNMVGSMMILKRSLQHAAKVYEETMPLGTHPHTILRGMVMPDACCALPSEQRFGIYYLLSRWRWLMRWDEGKGHGVTVEGKKDDCKNCRPDKAFNHCNTVDQQKIVA